MDSDPMILQQFFCQIKLQRKWLVCSMLQNHASMEVTKPKFYIDIFQNHLRSLSTLRWTLTTSWCSGANENFVTFRINVLAYLPWNLYHYYMSSNYSFHCYTHVADRKLDHIKCEWKWNNLSNKNVAVGVAQTHINKLNDTTSTEKAMWASCEEQGL